MGCGEGKPDGPRRLDQRLGCLPDVAGGPAGCRGAFQPFACSGAAVGPTVGTGTDGYLSVAGRPDPGTGTAGPLAGGRDTRRPGGRHAGRAGRPALPRGRRTGPTDGPGGGDFLHRGSGGRIGCPGDGGRSADCACRCHALRCVTAGPGGLPERLRPVRVVGGACTKWPSRCGSRSEHWG
jgi:hypothetical protein